MARKKKRGHLSVLLIPDDNSEPYSYRISHKRVRLLFVLGAVLILHFIGGGVFYWRFATVYSENRDLKIHNAQLLRDNDRIHRLASQLTDLERTQRKVNEALGITLEKRPPNTAPEQGVGARHQPHEGMPEMPLPRRGEPRSPSEIRSQFPLKFVYHKSSSSHYNNIRSVPTLLPVEGIVTTGFQRGGWLNSPGHQGIDIAAKEGTTIRAAADGYILFANWTNDFGNLIIIYHGDGCFTHYGHNQRLLKSARSFVHKGDPIALLGNTGELSSGPHLHFEIWRDGIPQDPMEYLLAFQEVGAEQGQ